MAGERIALYGGTFDPPHLGHLIVADTAREVLRLDRVEFLVAADPPHKAGIARSPFDDRQAMVELAVASSPHFAVNVSEGSRPGPSFTVDTLRLRRKLSPDEQLWFLMGADSLVDLPTWREPSRILELVRMAVAARPGSLFDIGDIERELPGVSAATDAVDTPLVDISSSALRQRVAAGRSIRYRVPEAVEAFIRSRDLYRDPAYASPDLRPEPLHHHPGGFDPLR